MTITYQFTEDDGASLKLVQKTENMFSALLELNRELKGQPLQLLQKILKSNELDLTKLSNND